jgi:Xaa-Pro aminopeptidase
MISSFFREKRRERKTGIDNSADLNTFYSAVGRLLHLTDTLYLPLGTSSFSPQNLSPELLFAESVIKIIPGARIKDLSVILGDLRWSKSAKEVEIMRKACAITVDTFKEAARFTKPGANEYELDTITNFLFKKNGSSGDAFTIIGSGPNSCILHHARNDRFMKEGELVVIDIGTIYQEITTDLTRTVPVSDVYDPEQRKIYNIVLDAQKKAISMVKPGVTLAQLHDAAMEVIEKAGYGKYFIQFLSHT